jgi:hypothetical protein
LDSAIFNDDVLPVAACAKAAFEDAAMQSPSTAEAKSERTCLSPFGIVRARARLLLRGIQQRNNTAAQSGQARDGSVFGNRGQRPINNTIGAAAVNTIFGA